MHQAEHEKHLRKSVRTLREHEKHLRKSVRTLRRVRVLDEAVNVRNTSLNGKLVSCRARRRTITWCRTRAGYSTTKLGSRFRND